MAQKKKRRSTKARAAPPPRTVREVVLSAAGTGVGLGVWIVRATVRFARQTIERRFEALEARGREVAVRLGLRGPAAPART